MKRHAYGSANLVPIVVCETCCLILLFNSKKLFFNTNSAILTKSSMGIHFLSCLSKASLRALNPTSWGMLGYNSTTSTVTKIALSGIVLRFLVLSMKSIVYVVRFKGVRLVKTHYLPISFAQRLLQGGDINSRVICDVG